MKSKRCSRCKEIKPFSEFHNNKSNKKWGKTTYCKDCTRIMHKEYIKPKYIEPKIKQDGTIDKRCLRRKEGYELPYHLRPQRIKWLEDNKENKSEYNKKYREENCEYLRKAKWHYLNSIRAEGIEAYGSKCVCCGESVPEFLTIDHINGVSENEIKHGRRRLKGKKLFLHLKSQNWPKNNYQLLCWNCNCAKGMYGRCPHQRG